jgi:hypothetical protein
VTSESLKNLDDAWKLQPGDLVSVCRDQEIPGVPCRVQTVRKATADVDVLYDFPNITKYQLPQSEIGREFPTVPLRCVERIFEVGDPVIVTDRDLRGNRDSSMDPCLVSPPNSRVKKLENIFRQLLGRTGIVLDRRWNGSNMRTLGIGLDGEPYDSLWIPAMLVHPYRAYAEVPAPTVPPEDGPLFAASEEPEPESCFETQIDMEDPPTGAMVLAQIGLSVVTLVAVLGWRNGKRQNVWWDVTTGNQVRDLRPVYLKTMFLPEMVSMGEQ